MRTIRCLFLLTTGLFVVVTPLLSCSVSGSEGSVEGDNSPDRFDMAKFEHNRELWTEKNIQNYKMVVGAWGFRTGYSEQVLIEVRDREMASIEVAWESGGGAGETSRAFDSVEKIFDFIADQHRRTVKKLDVKYDRDLGYPSSVEVDPDGKPKNGDELLVRIKKLEKTM